MGFRYLGGWVLCRGTVGTIAQRSGANFDGMGEGGRRGKGNSSQRHSSALRLHIPASGTPSIFTEGPKNKAFEQRALWRVCGVEVEVEEQRCGRYIRRSWTMEDEMCWFPF